MLYSTNIKMENPQIFQNCKYKNNFPNNRNFSAKNVTSTLLF